MIMEPPWPRGMNDSYVGDTRAGERCAHARHPRPLRALNIPHRLQIGGALGDSVRSLPGPWSARLIGVTNSRANCASNGRLRKNSFGSHQ